MGLRLRQRARALGLRDAEVARRAGITDKRYSNYVAGRRKPDPEMLRKISAALETTMDELVSAAPALLDRDRSTFVALRRFEEACRDLKPDDVGMLAEFARWMAATRRGERQADSTDPQANIRRRLAEIHERLVTSIALTQKPLLVNTGMENFEADAWLRIEVYFPGGTAREAALRTEALYRIARERLGVPFDEIRVSDHSPNEVLQAFALRIRLGPLTRTLRRTLHIYRMARSGQKLDKSTIKALIRDMMGPTGEPTSGSNASRPAPDRDRLSL